MYVEKIKHLFSNYKLSLSGSNNSLSLSRFESEWTAGLCKEIPIGNSSVCETWEGLWTRAFGRYWSPYWISHQINPVFCILFTIITTKVHRRSDGRQQQLAPRFPRRSRRGYIRKGHSGKCNLIVNNKLMKRNFPFSLLSS